jgi:hypothetical protein
MVPGELEADEHLGRGHRRKELPEMGVRGLEPAPVHEDLEGLAAAAVGADGYQDVELLGGIDADMDGELARVGTLLIGGHGRLRGGREPTK